MIHHLPTRCALLGLALSTWLPAQEPAAPAKPVEPAAAVAEAKDPIREAKLKQQEAFAADNKLETERLTQATSAMRAEVTQLKLERELLTEKLALEATKRQISLQAELTQMAAEKDKLSEQGELSKAKAEKLANDLKTVQTEAALDITRLQNDITRIEAEEKRDQFTGSKPVYLENPLKENGILVISDRRIPLNGMITGNTAEFITSRIQYWNNKDRKLPIFIVIDTSPGGSVMAGYRILKAMESSDAPVHVVVKSFAASMAAAITTLAKESYAYPNALILHHQLSAIVFGQLNLTQQRELHQENERWWTRLGTPVAEKMGISPDEFVKRMYSSSTSGDWCEFGEKAKELKWVNHIVRGIDETSVDRDPDTIPASKDSRMGEMAEQIDKDGQPFAWLPRLSPKDLYFVYNPDGYYRRR